MPEPASPTPPPVPDAPTSSPAAPAPSDTPAAPMIPARRPGLVLEALLKRPGNLIHDLHRGDPARLGGVLLAAAVACLALYGLAVGSFAGGVQWWAAQLKIVLGSLFSAVICLPSLYIFACLTGAEIRFGTLCGALAAVLCLGALLLVGFMPVVWVFSQSTDSVAFIGTMHLVFWLVSTIFALRLLTALLTFIRAGDKSYLRVWFIIFLLVCLQMMTAVRPIVGTTPDFLPKKKLFFLSHWGKNLSGEPE